MGEPVIQARRLFVVHRAATGNAMGLQGLSLDVGAGEILAVVGPSARRARARARC
ncbi:MAG TPA: hypothetical protein VF533_00220 [Solirubrobacteraceae bacterium]